MRLTGVDVLRHILAVAVIFLHIRSHARYSPELNHEIAVIQDYCEGAVMGFFMISGFFAKEQPGLSWTRFVAFLESSAKRLLIPFLLFSLVYACALAVLGKQSLVTGLRLTATLEGSSMQLYFLPFLFYVFLAFFVYTGLSHRLKVSPILSLIPPLAGFFALARMYPTTTATGPDVRLLPLYAACYVIGFYFSKAYKIQPAYFYAIASILTALFFFGASTDRRLMDMAEVTFLFWLAVMVSSFKWSGHRTLPGSGGVYLLHAPIFIYGISTFLSIAHVVNVPNVVLTVILTYVVCLALTLAIRAKAPSQAYLLLE